MHCYRGVFYLKKSMNFMLSIFLISVFILSLSAISAADLLNDTVLENVDSDIVSSSDNDLITVENNTENVVSQSIDNNTVNAEEYMNESVLGETEIRYGTDILDNPVVQVTTLTISGVKDYYYYGEIIKFYVYHSRYVNNEPKTTSVSVLIDNDVYNEYLENYVPTGATITLYAVGQKLGLHTIYARYSDHLNAVDEVNFHVLQNPVKFSKPTKKVKKSKKVKTFKITAKLANGKPLSKKYVYMDIKGDTYKARTTSKGVVTFKLLLPKKTKTYNYKIKYYGEYGYKAKTFSGKLKVR